MKTNIDIVGEILQELLALKDWISDFTLDEIIFIIRKEFADRKDDEPLTAIEIKDIANKLSDIKLTALSNISNLFKSNK